MALGIWIIQTRKGLSDKKTLKGIQENPYLQYSIGMETFSHKIPAAPSRLVEFRKRLTVDCLMEVNGCIPTCSDTTKEHKPEKESANAETADTATPDMENLGTEILDATCSPSGIRYPQDFLLLNEARENLEEMVDGFHKTYHPWAKPRTYRRVARKECLALAKAKERPAKKMRTTIRRQLGYVKRDLGYLAGYMGAGYALPKKHINTCLTILKLYEQQRCRINIFCTNFCYNHAIFPILR